MSHVKIPAGREAVQRALKDADPAARKRLRAIILFACVEKQAKFFGEAFGDIIPQTDDTQRGWLVLMKAGLPPKLFEAFDQQNWPFVSMLMGVALAGIVNGRLGNQVPGA